MYENKCYRQQGEYYEVGGHEVVVVLSKGVRASPLNKESEKVREWAMQQFEGITSSLVQSPNARMCLLHLGAFKKACVSGMKWEGGKNPRAGLY